MSSPEEGELEARFAAILARKAASTPTLIALLRATEEVFGEVSDARMALIAARAGATEEAVLDMARRSGVTRERVAAKHVIEVCTHATCRSRGSLRLLEGVRKGLGIEGRGASKDGLFAVCETSCLGACDFGPNARMGGEVIASVSERRLLRLARKAEPAAAPSRPFWWPFGGRR